MGDEISVTVIATGFDKDRVPYSSVMVDKVLDRAFDKAVIADVRTETTSDLDIPTFLRKNKKIIE